MIRGVNHVTFAVADLERSLAFYEGLLGMRLAARWPRGAYLR
ncbi:MAG TPA: VOC family protein, partial [Polyangiaceae bacterium LLY-WYZ-15_(1-7)]|nr:VOC family protein [Polyangiaceae bacterium LLY-WYZ-15_(1-7)]